MPSSQPTELGLAEALLTRTKGITSTSMILRVALATTISLLVAAQFSGSRLPIFAPITTLLVVQASPFSTLGIMTQRVLGTVVGVGATTVYVNFVPIRWWSVFLALVAALYAARRLPVGVAGQLQLPLATVFVLALGPGDLRTDVWRILDVLIGAGIGAAAVFVAPPRPRLQPAADSLTVYITEIEAVLRAMVTALRTPPPEGLGATQRHDFIERSRGLRGLAQSSRDAFTEAIESTRFNLRAPRDDVDLTRLGHAVTWAGRLAIQTRALAGGIDRLYDRSAVEPVLPPFVLADLLESLGDLVMATYERRSVDADRIVASLLLALRSATQDCVAAQPDVVDALDSIGLLGRVEQLRELASAGPDSEPEAEDMAPEPARRWTPRIRRRTPPTP